MTIAIIILVWLLISTWITLIIVGIDERWTIDEWIGMAFACIFSPFCFFIVNPIVLAVRRMRKR